MPLAAIAGLFVLGSVGAWILKIAVEGKADSFDLADVEKMEAASILYDRKGGLIGKIFLQNRNPIPFSAIPENMVHAVLAAEDNRFYEHDGVDFMGIIRAAITNYRSGRIRQGASTITQQLARNSFDLRDRTYQRKLVEMAVAHRIEAVYPKDKILEMYLNRVYFGSGFYGVEAAARGYFGVPAKEMTIGQCAMLAGLLKSPNALSPWNNPEGARTVRDFVIGRMRDQGFISAAQMRAERDAPLVTRRRANAHKVSYAVDYVRQQTIAALGYERAMNGGLQIFTTLDSTLQRAAEVALRKKLDDIEARPGYSHQTYRQFQEIFEPFDNQLRRGGFPDTAPPAPEYLQGAVFTIDNKTGGILTLVGGREFTHSEYNRATQSRRPAGTAFSPFVFATAYEGGIFPGALVEDAALDNRYVNIGGTTGILGEWGVERPDNEYEGGITATEALVNSKNAATVRLGWQAGLSAFKEILERAGIRSTIRNFSNAFLGTSEVTLEELTVAYSTFPGQGWRPRRPFMIQRIEDRDGTEIYEADPQKVPVISDAAAYQVHHGLEGALYRGTGAEGVKRFGLADMPAAGKTGTAYNFTDTYFVGYTSEVTCGVWVGFDKPTRIYRGAFGNELAQPIWTEVMNAAVKEFPPSPISRPESAKPVSICSVSGLLETGRCKHEVVNPATGREELVSTAMIEYATEANKPTIPCDVHGGGLRQYWEEPEESEWPRAVSAVDLAKIRPVAVSEPALAGLNDIYRSVRPAALRMKPDEIRVAKALPVDQQAAEAALADAEAMLDGEQVRRAEAVAPEDDAPREVRRAEAVRPLDVPNEAADIGIAPPPPIQF